MYSCEARSLSDFIRHVAVNYISRGYFFYVKGEIPPHKDPARTDAKIISQYGIAISKWQRARHRRRGEAGVQYFRYGRQFVLLATHGEHRFFHGEANVVKDVRRVPMNVGDYSVGYRKGPSKGYVLVRIARQRFRDLKSRLVQSARSAAPEDLVAQLHPLTFMPFAPVRRQLIVLVRLVNGVRRVAGLDTIPIHAFLRMHRCFTQSAR